MQHRCSLWLTATFLFYLSVNISSVSGKCKGKWKSHVCFGGNGKRSGAPVTDSDENQGLLLKRILFQSSDPVQDNYNELEDLYPTVVQTNDDINMSNEKQQDWTKEELQRLSDLVQEYLYRKRLRALTEEDAGLI